MSLKEKITENLAVAFKSGQSEIVSTLRFLNSAIKNKELEKRSRLSKEGKSENEIIKSSELNDEEITAVILSEIKKRKDSASQYESGGRRDLADKEVKEIEILKKYAPEEMPESDLRNIIKEKISELGKVTTKDFGKIMALVMAEVRGRAGGDTVKKIIEEELKNEP